LVVVWNRLDAIENIHTENSTLEKHWQPVLATNAHVAIPSGIVQRLYQ
jgi:hypothetical protein